MKLFKPLSLLILGVLTLISCTHSPKQVPDLSKIDTTQVWRLCNRNMEVGEDIYLDAAPGSGLLWMRDMDFSEGSIEADIKGRDEPGKSFVGIAFHGLNDSVYDAVYFRPFNFHNPERSHHSVQYISHPEYTWYHLRETYPEKYENGLTKVPEPSDWFHVRLTLKYPEVRVYINNSDEPSLMITQLSDRKKGWIGFWVGYGSEGNFKNLKIMPE